MKNFHIRCIADAGCTLGEGPVWDDQNNILYWVDILDNKIFRYDPSSGSYNWWNTPEHVGFIILKRDRGLIAGFKTGLHLIQLGVNGRISINRIDRIAKDRDRIRFNDGICDNQGRIWCCTMDMDQKAPLGKYYCYNKDFYKVVVDEGYVVANGPALSPDDQLLYTVETVGGTMIKKGVYVAKTKGEKILNTKELLINWNERSSVPDGIITDAQGNLWIGGFGGNTLRCYSAQGVLKGKADLPAWNITKAVFGGKNLDILYVTTARFGADEDILRKYPQTGGVFEIRGLDSVGQPTPYF